jgi:hypothetical protein
VNTLKIAITRVSYPHRDIDKPTEIRISVQTNDSTVELLNKHWDATPVMEWLAENARAISEDRIPPILENAGRSIAERIGIALDLVNPFDDAAVDAIYDYSIRHSLGLAFSGTPVANIYVGVGPDGGEISCFDPSNTWRYSVDLDQFPGYLETLAVEVAEAWSSAGPHA